MALTKEEKEKLVKEYQRDEKDTGSCEVQIAILTKEINDLTEHLKVKHYKVKNYLFISSVFLWKNEVKWYTIDMKCY